MATRRGRTVAPAAAEGCPPVESEEGPVLLVPPPLRAATHELSDQDSCDSVVLRVPPPDWEARMEMLELQLLKRDQSRGRKKRPPPSESDSEEVGMEEELSSEDSSSSLDQMPKKRKKARKVVVSSGDEFSKPKKRAVKKSKKRKTKRKKRKSSSSDSSSGSSSTESDSDTNRVGLFAQIGDKVSKKCEKEKAKKVRTTTLMRGTMKGHFNTFKPVEVIAKLGVQLTGIKGVPQSEVKEMDKDVHLNEERKKVEFALFTAHKAVLGALTAITPMANRMQAENKFSSLARTMDKGLGMLTAAGNFLSSRRYENVFKAVCTNAGREVARSKKIVDNDGKEYTLFLPPKPVKGKPLDKTKMFGGQLQHLFKGVEVEAKYGKNLDKSKPAEPNTQIKKTRVDFRRLPPRGGRGGQGFQPRGRGHRQSFGWNEGNRPFRREGPPAKPFPHPGNK